MMDATTVTSRGVTFRRPRQDEKTEQAQILTLVAAVGGLAYVLGTRRAQYCGTCGVRTTDQGTRQTPGIADLFVLLPPPPRAPAAPWVPVWVEVKGRGGTLTPEQLTFRGQCARAGLAHVVGGLDALLDFAAAGGWILPSPRDPERTRPHAD